MDAVQMYLYRNDLLSVNNAITCTFMLMQYFHHSTSNTYIFVY